MSEQSYSYYMRPQDRDCHNDDALNRNRKRDGSRGRGRSPSRNRDGRSRGRSCDSYGRNHNNYDQYMSSRSGRDHYNRFKGRDLVPPSHSHRSRSCDPRPLHHADQSYSQSRKRHHSSVPHRNEKHPVNVRFDQPHHHGSVHRDGLKGVHHDNDAWKDASYEQKYPLAPSKSNENDRNVYQAPAKRSKYNNESHVDKENRLNTYHGHNHEQPSRLRHSSTSYEPHRHPLASRKNLSSRTHLQQPRFNDNHTIAVLIHIAHDNLAILTSASIAAFWNKLSKQMVGGNATQTNRSHHHGDEDLGRCLYKILEQTMSKLVQFSGKDLSQTIHGMSKVTCMLRKNGKQNFSDVVRGCFLTSDMTLKKDIFRSLALASKDSLFRFDARGLSNLAYSYALIDYVPKFGDGSDDLFDHIATYAAECITKFNSQDLANLVWAYGKTGDRHSKLFEKVANHIVASNCLKQFNAQDLANTGWAYATAGIFHSKLFGKLADHIVASNNFDRFNSQELANTAWAYAKAGIYYPKLFEKMANHIVASNSLGRFNSQALANVAWAYATMGISNKYLFSSIALNASKMIDSFNAQNLANTAWAYAVAGVDVPTLFNDHFLDVCIEKSDGFSVEGLSQLHQWHLWQMNEMSRDGLPEALVKSCFEAFVSEDTTESTLQKNVIAQLSAIGLDPEEEKRVVSGYSIDAVVKVNGKTIGVEIDGPSHFISRSKFPTGSTILKRRQVLSIDDIEIVSVPYWEWNELGSDEMKEQKYLWKLLGL